ncbi:metallophosphoesterase family protein [Rubrivivax gelatinosus]|uniref:Putative phosphodiesterase n=1 Tax=Rubrivivax gelatinosus TaxID=28068 RepID=A0A4R2MEN7_RUBGE|nr:metallophosphoesterase family protein [Rubrivivax gelatinosus]MBK1689451.1 YfcE family phosphodiesterase [Rubrivivax gelatinosus]TCO97402.1 putative phosphodiesterase [Rubrivivax gelatinosus]
MRWAIVSDIHGNLPALEAVIADAGAVDGWLNLGDIVSGPLWPRETARRLMALGWPTIAGNHERQLLAPPHEHLGASDRFAFDALGEAERAWLAALPATMAPHPDVLAVHGSGRSDLEYLLHSVRADGLHEADEAEIAARLPAAAPAWLLCGHSHLPRQRRVGATTVLNPGSVGLPAFDHDQPGPHVAETGTPQARYAWLELGPGGWQATLRAVDYDHEVAARRAEAQGRGDWADALRSGRVGRRETDITAGGTR